MNELLAIPPYRNLHLSVLRSHLVKVNPKNCFPKIVWATVIYAQIIISFYENTPIVGKMVVKYSPSLQELNILLNIILNYISKYNYIYIYLLYINKATVKVVPNQLQVISKSNIAIVYFARLLQILYVFMNITRYSFI